MVSIIIPCYNSEKTIRKTINSIINQSYNEWEALITDDCSNDNTWNIISKYAKLDKRIKIFRLKKNSGAGIARNNSIKSATGRYIAFCDSDDIWNPNKLELQLSFLKKNDLSFTCSGYEIIDENDIVKGKFIPPKTISYDSLLKTCDIGCLTVIYDTKKIGKFLMSHIRTRQDYELWLRMFKKIKSSKTITQPLAKYRISKDSVSRNKLMAAFNHLKIILRQKDINLFLALYYFSFYIFYGIKKNY